MLYAAMKGRSSTVLTNPVVRAVLAGVGAGYVAFEFLDGLGLAGDDPFDEIADGDDANYLIVVDDGEMPEAVLGHDRHALVDSVLRGDEDDGAGHDFMHASLFRGVAH